jgi:hypothetical protein
MPQSQAMISLFGAKKYSAILYVPCLQHSFAAKKFICYRRLKPGGNKMYRGYATACTYLNKVSRTCALPLVVWFIVVLCHHEVA